MTESQLKLGKNLSKLLKKLNKERAKFKASFDFLFEADPETETLHIKLKKKSKPLSFDKFKNEFPRLELLKLYEYRIQQLDLSIDEVQGKFNNL